MKYKVITTYKPDDWNRYSKRCVQSILKNWPDVSLTEARDERFEAKKKIKVGIDHNDKRKENLEKQKLFYEQQKKKEGTTSQLVKGMVIIF